MTEDNDIDLTLLHTPYTSQDYHDYEKRVLRNYLLTQAAFLKKPPLRILENSNIFGKTTRKDLSTMKSKKL